MLPCPIFTHWFARPLPYLATLVAQNKIHAIQLAKRQSGAPDVMLLLEHRPVYTAGRRQKLDDLALEKSRLEGIGADWVQTDRGGQTTYHGPGQLTAYPLLDLGRMKASRIWLRELVLIRVQLSVRDYVSRLELALREQLLDHGLAHCPSEHTGVFLSPDDKIASIGVHIRHRLTTHGVAMNVTTEPTAWFDQVVACGLDGVRAASIQGAGKKAVAVSDEAHRFAEILAKKLGRDTTPLDGSQAEIWEIVQDLERAAAAAGPWPTRPINLR